MHISNIILTFVLSNKTNNKDMATKTLKDIYHPVAVYNGIMVVQIVTYEYGHDWASSITTHFELCLCDGTPKPFKKAENRLYTYYKTFEAAREAIKQYLNGSLILYTDEQRQKYVHLYLKKHSWGFTRNRLLATMRMHKKGDEVMKLLMEDRLEDANFHDYCGALADRNYDKFMEILNKEY